MVYWNTVNTELKDCLLLLMNETLFERLDWLAVQH